MISLNHRIAMPKMLLCHKEYFELRDFENSRYRKLLLHFPSKKERKFQYERCLLYTKIKVAFLSPQMGSCNKKNPIKLILIFPFFSTQAQTSQSYHQFILLPPSLYISMLALTTQQLHSSMVASMYTQISLSLLPSPPPV